MLERQNDLAVEMRVCAETANASLESVRRLADLQVTQKESFDMAMDAFQAAQTQQKTINSATENAINHLQKSVEEMKAHMAALQRHGFTAEAEERPNKAAKTNVGKGGSASQRSSSAEPSCTDADLNLQGGNARIAHILIAQEGTYIPSRIHRACTSFAKEHTPQLFADGGEVSFKARQRGCQVTFFSSSSCNIFINHVAGMESPTLTLGEGPEAKVVKVRIKHDEPLESRRRKFMIGKAWETLQEMFAAKNPGGGRLLLHVNHAAATISFEGEDWKLHTAAKAVQRGAISFDIQFFEQVKHIKGFGDDVRGELISKLATKVGPQH
jgi:hypothetical protein